MYLRWLPVPIHKQLDCLLRHIQSDWRRLPLPGLLSRFLGDSRPSSPDSRPPTPRGEYGLRALTLDEKPFPEADAGRIAALALEDVDRYFQVSVVLSLFQFSRHLRFKIGRASSCPTCSSDLCCLKWSKMYGRMDGMFRGVQYRFCENVHSAFMLDTTLLNYRFAIRDGPLLVVASGRDTVPVAAAVKKLAPEATFVVQV